VIQGFIPAAGGSLDDNLSRSANEIIPIRSRNASTDTVINETGTIPEFGSVVEPVDDKIRDIPKSFSESI
jgi:hypothetical protein